MKKKDDWLKRAREASKAMQPVWSDAKTKRERKKLYTTLIPNIRAVAAKNGYAIGVHGSMTRDLDLIAVKWRDGAVKADTLAVRIHKAVCKYPYSLKNIRATNVKQKKPQGRVGYSLILGHGGAYIDLSVFE